VAIGERIKIPEEGKKDYPKGNLDTSASLGRVIPIKKREH